MTLREKLIEAFAERNYTSCEQIHEEELADIALKVLGELEPTEGMVEMGQFTYSLSSTPLPFDDPHWVKSAFKTMIAEAVRESTNAKDN